MKLKELTLENCEQVRQWRNECLEALRTPFPLTKEMQEKFYREVVCDRNARARHWGVWEEIEQKYECPYNVKDGPKVVCASERRCYHVCPYVHGFPLSEKKYAFIGMVGLENIEWENGNAEISIILNPEFKGKGYGEQAVNLLLEQGFFFMNLETIWGECYTCNPALSFWKKIAKKYMARCADIPFTKFWKYQYYDSFYFAFLKEDYNYVKNNT